LNFIVDSFQEVEEGRNEFIVPEVECVKGNEKVVEDTAFVLRLTWGDVSLGID